MSDAIFPNTTHQCGNEESNYENHFKLTPWEVEGEIDYNKLIKQFGTEPITKTIIDKVMKLTGDVHPMLKLQYFFSHRDFDWILNKYENGEKFYLYTGRGPSGMVHMGHLLPWFFTKYLQDKFGSDLIFQLTDDEKFLHGQTGPKKRSSITPMKIYLTSLQ